MPATDLPMSLPPATEPVTKQLLIGGEWCDAASGRRFPSINPSTGRVIAELAEGDREDVDRAVAAARRALAGPWASFTPAQRQDALLRLAAAVESRLEELRLLDVEEMGAPIGRPGPAAAALNVIKYYAGWATKIYGETVANSVSNDMFTYTVREPIGVVAGIIPWNAPLTACLWKICPVLATGCTIVLKPAEEASLSALMLGEIIMSIGLPEGVVNIVTGFGETAGAALTKHPGVDKVAFTGSTATGQAIVRAASGNLKRVTLELGGKSPDIIFADCDLDAAVPGASMGVFGNSGQVCTAGTRIYVERPIYEEFTERAAAFAASLRVGNSMNPETQIGPIVSQPQLEKVLGYIASGQADGARTAAGGSRLVEGDLANGYFVPPTVFVDVHDDMTIAREEIFGPVAAVMPFDTIEEVIGRANDTPFGLGAGVWTRNVGTAHRMARSINSGMVWVNTYGNSDPSMPFGGVKMSGWGREMSVHSLDNYLNIKAVWIKTA